VAVRRRQWAAFEDFVQVNGDSLVRLSYLLCGDHGQAEIAVQEALTRVCLRWRWLDDPLPYARRSVVNQTRDQWRTDRREQRERSAAGAPASGPALLDDVIAERDRLVQALDPARGGQAARCGSRASGPRVGAAGRAAQGRLGYRAPTPPARPARTCWLVASAMISYWPASMPSIASRAILAGSSFGPVTLAAMSVSM
jgi:hypothetical protein